jgi:hypothetical protein
MILALSKPFQKVKTYPLQAYFGNWFGQYGNCQKKID